MSQEAAALEEACKHFLSTHSEALPRVAFRAMVPVLDAFIALVRARPEITEGRNPVPIYIYPLPKLFDHQHEGLKGAVLLDVDDKALYWIAGIPTMTPYGPALFTPLNSPAQGRKVSPEDLVELNITLREVAENLMKLAVGIQTTTMANMPPASA